MGDFPDTEKLWGELCKKRDTFDITKIIYNSRDLFKSNILDVDKEDKREFCNYYGWIKKCLDRYNRYKAFSLIPQFYEEYNNLLKENNKRPSIKTIQKFNVFIRCDRFYKP